MTLTPLYKILLCDIINPKNDKNTILIRNGAIVLKRTSGLDYKIEKIVKRNEVEKDYASKRSIEIYDCSNMLAMPGFFDMHFHWVQDEVCDKPKDNLLTWLENYTWPYESKFKSKKFAKDKAETFSDELFKLGTLGGGCFSSIHGHALEYAQETFVGDFIIGNVLMTMNSPDYLCQTQQNAKTLIEKFSKKYKKTYALTPRFAPTTHPDVMSYGAKLARRNQNFIQTHLCETKNEIDYVMSLYSNIKGFEKVKSYTEIYEKSGILGPRTIMGHGIHLTQDELKVLRKTKTVIAHCPSSNAPVRKLGLGSGLFDFERIERAKIRWVLASDIGAGPYLSMFDVMRSYCEQNIKKGTATFQKALYRATLAGAEVLNISSQTGSLDNGKWANFILVESPKIKKSETAEDVLKTLISRTKKIRSNCLDLAEMTVFRGRNLTSL